MVVFPNIKINLGLQIIGKRPDGYHNLASCFYPAPWADILEIIESETFKFSSSGRVLDIEPEKNLCVKAYRLLAQDHPLPPVHMHLHKVLPDGAGLGGGSADASFALTLLNQKFELGLSVSELEAYAAQLGSDCPFFIQNRPMMVSGRGEKMTPAELSLKGWHLVVVFPACKVSTAMAFAHIKPQEPDTSLSEILRLPPSSWKGLLVNDFEQSVIPQFPVIEKVKAQLYESGAVYASMSGSGSAVYGLFEKAPSLQWPKGFISHQSVLS